jgi:uncharacterized protein YcfL
MRSIYGIVTIWLLTLFLITGCTSKEPKKEVTVDQVLQQSIVKMKDLSGSKREVTETLTNPNKNSKLMKLNSILEIMDESHFYLKQEYAYDSKKPNTREFYRNGDLTYVVEPSKNKNWIKINTIGESAAQLFSFTKLIDPYNYHFVYSLERMKELAKQVKKSETDKEYVFEIQLKDSDQIGDFLLPFVEINTLNRNSFNSLNMKVWIDKQSMQLNKVEEKKEYKSLQEQTTITVFTSQIKQITAPKGTRNVIE